MFGLYTKPDVKSMYSCDDKWNKNTLEIVWFWLQYKLHKIYPFFFCYRAISRIIHNAKCALKLPKQLNQLLI